MRLGKENDAQTKRVYGKPETWGGNGRLKLRGRGGGGAQKEGTQKHQTRLLPRGR